MKKSNGDKIRIIRVITRMNIGGPAIQITGLMQNLPVDEFEQKLVFGICDNDEEDYLKSKKISVNSSEILELGRRVNLLSDLKSFMKIRRIIKNFNPHIVHTHTTKAGLIGRLAAITTNPNIKLVHTFHGHLLYGYFGNYKTKLIVILERILAVFTHQLVTVGVAVKRDLVNNRIGSPDKYSVVEPGLELGALVRREVACKKLKLNPHVFRISWIGRAVPIKAPLRVIELAEAAKDLNLNLEFTVVGDGPLLKKMKEQASSTFTKVKFLSWQNEIEIVLSSSDLVLLTSLNEGTPIALIQAQMAGVPVLATDVGSSSEVLQHGETGFCLGYDLQSFLHCIELMCTNPNLQHEFGRKARKFAMEKFSINAMINSYSGIYKSLL